MIGKRRNRSDGIGRPVAAASVAFALCFAGFASWTAQAPLASAVLAPDRIAVAGENKTVQHLEGGIVAEILVSKGASVEAGQPLVRLDTADAQATQAELIAERDALAVRAVRLRAELENRSVPDFSGLASENKAVLDDAIAGQMALFETRTK